MCTKSGAQQFFYAGGMGAVSVFCAAVTAAIVRALICGTIKLVPRVCDKIRQYRASRRDAKIRESVLSMQPTLQTLAMTAAAFEMDSGVGSPVHVETV
ncbi:hypothetical protein BCR39DRAFT_561659 [Naematelia encephala]|uniref:Uncharacterized protein n=1 Tax=Naematelia encephala TaxID=71784 RepID=A0A1Y2ANQ1_9TREE|nr:hypothetical protein BCR39DRAFT_561659 [Naematelia encephala]